MGIEYIPGEKNVAADALSQLPNNGNQDTIHEWTYTTENISELYNIKGLTGIKFSLPFRIIDRYHW